MELLLEKLKEKDDSLCNSAAKEIERLRKELECLQHKYEELGSYYDRMSKDLLKLYDEYGKLKQKRN